MTIHDIYQLLILNLGFLLLLPYFISILLILAGWYLLRPLKIKEKVLLPVSLVIPFKNEQANIPSLVADLLAQKYPERLMEIILVDDHSSDRGMEVLTPLIHSHRHIRVLKSEGEGKKQALKTGIDFASHELVISGDADCRMGPDWIGSLVQAMAKKKADLLIGPVALEGKKRLLSQFQQMEYLALQGVTGGMAGWRQPVICSGANLCFRRADWLEVWPELKPEIPSGDDVFLLHALKARKKRIRYLKESEAIVRSSTKSAPLSMLQQRSRWVSKGKAYTDLPTLLLAFIALAGNLALPVLLIHGFFNPWVFLSYGLALLLKGLADYLLVQAAGSFFRQKVSIPLFLLFSIGYPFYVLYLGIATLLKRL